MLVTALGAGAACLIGPATADTLPAAQSRAATWVVGDNLSLAAMLYAQNHDPQATLEKAADIAEDIGIPSLPPFPTKAAKQSETDATIVHYLIAGEGAAIGARLGQLYGADHATLFELAVKSNLLIWLYGPDDDMGLGKVIEDRATSAGLPTNLWMPMVSAVRSKKPADDVKDAVFKAHAAIQQYLIDQMPQ